MKYTDREMSEIKRLAEEEHLLANVLTLAHAPGAKISMNIKVEKENKGFDAPNNSTIYKQLTDEILNRMIECSKERNAIYTTMAIDLSSSPPNNSV